MNGQEPDAPVSAPRIRRRFGHVGDAFSQHVSYQVSHRQAVFACLAAARSKERVRLNNQTSVDTIPADW